MTAERREDVLVIAIVLSIALHVVLMAYVRPKVMTHTAAGVPQAERRVPMHFARAKSQADLVDIEGLEDVEAERSAPTVKDPGNVMSTPDDAPPTPAVAETPVATPLEIVQKLFRGPEVPAQFAETTMRLTDRESTLIPKIEVAAPTTAPALAAPGGGKRVPVDFAPRQPSVTGRSVALAPPVSRPVGADLREVRESVRSFVPSPEVLEKVDEKVVAEEKAAVRELMDAENAVELQKFVNVQVVRAIEKDSLYFKVMFVPRHELQIVPKDLVILIDASGSIGKERISSIRSAAKDVLRQVANSGDRFNLVAFRDRYSYAFRSWQGCTQTAFDAADRWLDDVAAHGRTDVFATISSVLTLPRDPSRPLIALVITDGDANKGVSSTAAILSKFTALNDGLISVYMYGVRSTANRELIDVLTHGNRGESFIYDGWRWGAGSGIENLANCFRDPVLSDLRIVFSSDTKAEAYPRLLRNLYRNGTAEIYGRVPVGAKAVSFSVKGLNGKNPYESYFSFPVDSMPEDPSVVGRWKVERDIDIKLRKEKE